MTEVQVGCTIERVVGERVSIDVEEFEFDYEPRGNVEHLRKHEVTPSDVMTVLDFGPLFYRNTEGHWATHIMIGRDAKGRSLLIALRAGDERGVWKPITGYRARIAHRLLEEEGRI